MASACPSALLSAVAVPCAPPSACRAVGVAGAVVVAQPADGIFRTRPIWRMPFGSMPLAAAIAFTVVPNRFAIENRVSPAWTRYVFG